MKLLSLVPLLFVLLPAQVTADAEKVWKSLLRESHTLKRERRYDEAVGKARQAVELSERAFGAGDPKTAQSLRQLAYAYGAERRYDDSVPALERAVVIVEKHYGTEHEKVADYLSTLAIHLGNQRQRERAEALHKRALKIREDALGPDHIKLAYTLNSLANYERMRGNYQKAEALLTRALRIRQKNLDPDHGWIAESWSALARLYEIQRRYAEAVDAQRRALAIKIAKHGGTRHRAVQGYTKRLAKLEADLAKFGGGESTQARSPVRTTGPAAAPSVRQEPPAVATQDRNRVSASEQVPLSRGIPPPVEGTGGRKEEVLIQISDLSAWARSWVAPGDPLSWLPILAGVWLVLFIIKRVRRGDAAQRDTPVQDMNPARRELSTMRKEGAGGFREKRSDGGL